jgi:5'-methylthioadenosine phosphorylase
MTQRVIGIIGGSGIYDLDGLSSVERITVDTPFGAPSDALVTGMLGDARLVFVARHGQGHRILPHEINYRANLFALKKLGAEWVISLSAVGSMRENIRPGDLVVVDQFFDRTHGRASTFFGNGIAAHVGFGDPVSTQLAGILHTAATEVVAETGSDVQVHRGGTYMVMNGPQFSTRAESMIYRQLGIDVIGMTAMPEAKLAREAEISYATLALATDYDCWHESEEEVSADAVVAIVRANAAIARQIVKRAVGAIPAQRDCPAATALRSAIMTDPSQIPPPVARDLAPIIGKYLS